MKPATLRLVDASTVSDLFKRQATKVRRYLSYRLRNDEDGKDAVQETFLRLVRRERAGELREDANNAYLFSAAYTVAIDAERERALRARIPAADIDADAVPSGQVTPEDELHWRKAMEQFTQCVRRLERGPRMVFVMRYFKGMTYPQIADQLGLTLRTTERHVAKALAELRAQMKDYL